MQNQKERREGFLALARTIIENILSDPRVKGLIFACKRPGEAINVDLDIFKVLEENGKLRTELCFIDPKYKKGTASPFSTTTGSLDDFQFHYLAKLEADGYAFGFYENFEYLFEGRDKEEYDTIYIGGGIKAYPPGAFEKNNYFTFSITIGKSKGEILAPSGQTSSDEQDESGPAGITEREEGLAASIAALRPMLKMLGSEEDDLNYEGSTDIPLGLFPESDHCIGCPPYWPNEAVSKSARA